MTRPAYRSMLWGIGLLAAAWVLLEVLLFRVAAASIGHPLAVIGSFSAPAAGALMAAIVGWRSGALSETEVARRAAHWATLGGFMAAIGAIGFTWASQEIAKAKGYGNWVHVAVAVFAATVAPMILAGAAALALRRLHARVGRALFAMGVGGALGALCAPLVMGTVGAPRGIICTALLAAAAAAGFGLAAGSRAPKWSFVVTLPLVVSSLVLGDYGEPWLKWRIDTGRRSKVDHAVWTSQGVFAFSSVTKTKGRLSVDRRPSVPIGVKQKGAKKPRFYIMDLQFMLNVAKDERGPVLVVGMGGGRDAEVALAYGHPRVDAVTYDSRVVHDGFYDRYVDVSRALFLDERVKIFVADTRLPDGLAKDYEHVFVRDKVRVDPASPRLLGKQDHAFTQSSIKEFLARVRPGGTLMMEVKNQHIARTVRSVLGAMPDPATAPDHVLACAGAHYAMVMVSTKAFTPGNKRKLIKKCKRAKSHVRYPLEEIKQGRRDHDSLAQDRKEKLAAIETATAVTDDKPYLASPSAGLRTAMVAAARGLRPMPDLKPTAKKGKEDPEFVPPPTPSGLAALAMLVAGVLAILTLLVPLPASPSAKRTSALAKPGFMFLGAALALASLAVNALFLKLFDTGLAAWSLAVPLGLLGVGAGHLLADTTTAATARRSGLIGLGVATAWLLAMAFGGGALAGVANAGVFVKSGVGAVALVGTGALLAFPAGCGFRIVARDHAAGTGVMWSLHLGGWVLGSACGSLAVHYVGMSGLWLVAVGALIVGAGLWLGATAGHDGGPAASPAE